MPQKKKNIDVRDLLNNKNSVIIQINDQEIKLKEEDFVEMAFIHNAVQNGFTVKKLSNNSFELQKETTKEIKSKNFTKKLIKENMDISTLLKKN
jgi:hypothetical protein